MEPVPFEMIELNPRHPTRTELTGTIWRGHLERPGRHTIIETATAQVVNTVYFHRFDPDTEPLDQLEYLLFGKAPDLFLAHVITRPPDFDQILDVTISGAGPRPRIWRAASASRFPVGQTPPTHGSRPVSA